MRRSILRYSQERAMTVVLLGLIITFSITAPSFLTKINFLNIASGSAYVAIVAVGMTVLFIVGEFDLSLGAVYGMAGTVIGYYSSNGASVPVSLLYGLGAGVIIGLANGLFTTVGRIPSFIVTIGMLSALQGLAQYLSAGQPLEISQTAQHSWLATFAGSSPWTIPMPVIVAGVVLVFTAVLLRTTRLGAHIYLTGGNPKAARQVGISTIRVKVFCFVFAAVLAAIAGTMQTFSLGSAQPSTGSGDFLFQAVGAAIIGGVALTGGEGSIYGTLVGASILGVLNAGLVLSGVDPGLTLMLTGGLIVLAGLLRSGMQRFLAQIFRRTRTRASRI
jgi:ribose/xylose/arabinose/galactoside ABC-type transport system permease subunit